MTNRALPHRVKDNVLTRMLMGAGYLLWAIKTITSNRKLFWWSSATVLLNVVVYGGLFALGFWLKDSVSGFVLGHVPFLVRLPYAGAIIETLLVVAWFFACIFLAIAVASVISGPLLDVLSEETERLLTGHVVPAPFSIWLILREAAILVVLTLRGMFWGVFFALFFGWVPVVGQALPFVIASFFVALNFLQPALARHNLKRKERLALADDNKALIFGFGAPANVIPFLLVPLLTPALVVGGTRLFLALAAHRKVPSKLSRQQVKYF